MEGINIETVLHRIDSSKVKDRKEGLRDLQVILNQNRRNKSLKDLKDRAYAAIFLSLFQLVKSEKSNYARPSTKQKQAASTILSDAANVIRLTAEVGLRNFRNKTIRLVLTHIVEIAPESNGQFCQPLIKDYLRTLRTILEYQPHAAHVPEDQWYLMVEFCNGCIKTYRESVSDEVEGATVTTSIRSHRGLSRQRDASLLSRSTSPSSFSRLMTPSRASFAQTDHNGSSSSSRQLAEEAAACLHHLLSVPHAPVLSSSRECIDTVLLYLQNLSPLSRPQGQKFSFRCINRILFLAITDNLGLALQLVIDTVPLIRRLWQSKCHGSLKEEMLITLILTDPLFDKLMQRDEWATIELELKGLVEVLQAEYSKRNEKDLLHDADIELDEDNFNCKENSLRYQAFSLRLGSPRSEQAWMLLRIVAVLYSIFARSHPEHLGTGSEDEETGRRYNKRRKIDHPYRQIFELVSTSSDTEQVSYLQVLVFLAGQAKVNTELMRDMLEFVIPLVSNPSVALSNWAMLTATCLALSQTKDQTTELSAPWMQVWRVASRRVTSAGCSRLACHLLNVLIRTMSTLWVNIKDSIDNMIASVELNAPAVLCDSSTSLLSTILKVKAKHSPSTLPDVSGRIIRWVFLRWKPSWSQQRHGDGNIVPIHSCDILQLLSVALGLGWQFHRDRSVVGGERIAMVALSIIEKEGLINYLLLKEVPKSPSSIVDIQGYSEGSSVELGETHFRRLYSLVAGSLSAEIDTVLGVENASQSLSRQPSSADAVGDLVTLSLAGFAIALSGPRNTSKTTTLQSKAFSLGEYTAQQILTVDRPRKTCEGLQVMLGDLLRVMPSGSANALGNVQKAAHLTARSFGHQFWQRVYSKESSDMVAQDLMDVDETPDSQQSQGVLQVGEEVLQLDWTKSCFHTKSCELTLTMRIIFASSISRNFEEDGGDEFHCASIPSDFIDFLTEQTLDGGDLPLSDSRSLFDFLAARVFFKELFDAGLSITNDAICKVLEYIADTLELYEFERNEVNFGVSLQIMTSLASIWTLSDDDNIMNASSQLYDWFVTTALPSLKLSPHVHVCMASMLLKVIQSRPEYRRSNAIPSAKASLFKILEEGAVTVKYEVGISISSIFGLFILKEHDRILDDIVEHLPMVPSWLEGTAMRIFVLSHLGAAWSTLRRRCLYAIVEAPSIAPLSTDNARHCMAELASKLQLGSPRDLFKLFASQILYTWMSTRPMDSLPYRVFDYNNFKELLLDVQDEATAQVIMRGRQHEIAKLVETFELSIEKLSEQAFGRSAAYVIARDSAVDPKQDTQAAKGAQRLRKIVGKERFNDLVRENFPEILATLFKIVDREDSIIKGFERKEAHTAAHSIYDEIISSGASQSQMTFSQQPSFKAACLVDEIEYVCGKVKCDPSEMWTPALYIFVFRELMKTMHSALGSLHMVTVIRRIRILISMAGKHTLSSYPLEMSLHALRPYLTDSYCAEDVMGIFKYLITKGSPYLEGNTSFFASIILTSLVSLRAFLDTPSESTTQASEYRKIMTKAQQFQAWIGSFANEHQFKSTEVELDTNFRALIAPACRLQGDGNATKGSGESELLLALLSDQSSDVPLIEEPLRDLVIGSLSKNFEVPPSPSDDILGSDRQAARYVTALWKSFYGKRYGEQFSLWVARTLGRAYAGSGFVVPAIIRESSELRPVPKSVASSQFLTSESIFSILSVLRDMLLAGDIWETGLVERALQSIASYTYNDEPLAECVEQLPASLLPALSWSPFVAPKTVGKHLEDVKLSTSLVSNFDGLELKTWTQQMCSALVGQIKRDPLLAELFAVISSVHNLSGRLLPYIVHLVLLSEFDKTQNARQHLSTGARELFGNVERASKDVVKQLIEVILYLRSQPIPLENTPSDRCRWLDIDYQDAANAAAQCGMFKTALLFLELGVSETIKTSSRRASSIVPGLPTELLMSIFRNLDDKDFFYGIDQPSSLPALTDRLEFECAGFKSLSFRGALYDSQIRSSSIMDQESEEGVIRLLSSLDLNGLSQSMFTGMADSNSRSTDAMFEAARKLEKWDLSTPSTVSSQGTIVFKVFQDIHDASSHDVVRSSLDAGFSSALSMLEQGVTTEITVHSALGALAVLAETEEVLTAANLVKLQDTWNVMEGREPWMRNESFEKSAPIMSCRRTLYSTLSKSRKLQGLLRVSTKDSRVIESQALLASASLARHHGLLQSSLDAATHLISLVEPCQDLGVPIDASARFELSNVFWDQGEMTASIRMIREVLRSADLQMQSIPVGRPELLAKLSHRISEARQEKPDEIIESYLVPAKKELSNNSRAREAGQVFHEFAAFCDQQLQNPDNSEDLERVKILRERKMAEIQDLDRMIKAATSQSRERENLKRDRAKAKQWYDLDNAEYSRLRRSRAVLLNQSLENYLLCLQACDTYDNDALRFSALWLEHSEDDVANETVARNIDQVESRKFAALMNQWTSRLLENESSFQKTLVKLVLRICLDHPYHGMYHIFASSKTKGGKDEKALSRNGAANALVNELRSDKQMGPTWIAIHNSSVNYVKFAAERAEDGSYKQGAKIPLRKSKQGSKLESDLKSTRTPPATMSIDLRPDKDYSNVPVITRFQSEFSIASGVSMPKVLTAIGSDGKKYKQLFKSGNDDLRQDAIMEQVFEQVSNLLKAQRESRQRNLSIRTYKVLALTATAGVIEWVPNTLPLNEYLMPAHQRHFPADMKPNQCRKAISDAQPKPAEQRIRAYRQVCDKFHPVLRYFYMERFEAPDDWFVRRLAYTRSTAAISILGHILGLGDRHGHNILLDEKSGEVVHIDLGIAFEQGRILPVPELVPFRLTRDVVDGMGITRTEGVFRRCCEFTLEALRNEAYSIMTILDVLRYDPLHNWSMSPLRLKRLQDDQAEAAGLGKGVDANAGGGGEKKDEEGEADRALTVVGKKLSKTLSVTATVNELIQQATDERNLALLFCGWAAYA